MPATRPGEGTRPFVPRERRRPRPTSQAHRAPAPQTRRPDLGGPGPSVATLRRTHRVTQRRAARAVPSQRVQVRHARAQARTYGSPSQSRRAARVNRRQMRQAKRLRMAEARRRFFPTDAFRATRASQVGAEQALARLRASNPERYRQHEQRASRSGVENAVRDVASSADKGLKEGARFLKTKLAQAHEFDVRHNPVKTAGPAPDVTKPVREAIDIVANTPSGAYMSGAAGVEAINEAARRKLGRKVLPGGHGYGRGKKLVKDFTETSALAPAAVAIYKNAQGKGASKEWGQALHRAKERPITTALELSGAKALVGRSAGAAARSGAFGKTVKRAGSTERANLKLYDPKTEGAGPEIQREYSRDIINKGLQKGHEAIQRRRGHDPNVDRGTRLVPSRPLVRRRLRRRIDTRHATFQRVLHHRRITAEREAKKAAKGKNPRLQHHLEVAARADKIRAELRDQARTATKAERKHIRETVSLSDEKLLDFVEAAAKPRLERAVERRGYTKEEQDIIARSLDRRLRRGKSLTPTQRRELDAAIGRRIQRDVAARKAPPEHPLAGVVRGALAVGQKGPNIEAVNAAFQRAGGKLPVVVRPFSKPTTKQGLYAGIKRNAEGKQYHVVYYNPKYGTGASNAGVWHELGHALRQEQGHQAPEYNQFITPEAYRQHPEEVAARAFQNENMDTDLFAPFGHPGAFERRSAPRDVRGLTPLRGSDFGDYLANLQAERAGGVRMHLPHPRDEALASMRATPEDMIRTAGTRSMEQTLAEYRGLIRDEFGIAAGKAGFAKSKSAAQDWANKRLQNPDLVPFKVGEKNWVLLPRDVEQRFAEHTAVDTGPFRQGGPLDRRTNVFKDVVLTTSSPFRWLGGNVGDLGMRTLLEGITPLDIARGMKGAKAMRREGLQGEMAAQATTGGGLYHTGAANTPSPKAYVGAARIPVGIWRGWKRTIYGIEQAIEEIPQYGAYGKVMRRDTARMKGDLKGLLKLHDQQINAFAHKAATDRALEARIQKKTEDVIGRWGKISPNMRRTLSLAPFAQWLGAATRYVYVTLPVHHPIKTGVIAGISAMTEQERERLGLSYFAPAENRAPDYQMGTLPLWVTTKDNVEQVIRQRGLTGDAADQLRRAVSHGPVVEGIRTSRMTSLGTAGSTPWNLPEFLMPQISSGLNALAGRSFTGEQLMYGPEMGKREGLPVDMPDRLPIALGAQLETMVPFLSAFRRAVLEQGRPADPTSTILTPKTRPKFNYDTNKYETRPGSIKAGALDWFSPFAPRSRIYTLGAGRDIERSQQTLRQLEQWNQRKKNRPGSGDIFAPRPGEQQGNDPADIFQKPRALQKKDRRDIFQ